MAFGKKNNEPEDQDLEVLVEFERPLTHEERAVIGWRRQQLQQAGFTAHWSDVIAANHHVDYHKAITMKHNGCDQELIYDLLVSPT